LKIESGAAYVFFGFVMWGALAVTAILSGPHKIEVKDQTGGNWQRDLEVLDDSDVRVMARLVRK
jgi:hypothetical protein